MLDALLDQFRNKDRHALARLLTLASRGESLPQIRQALQPPTRSARVVAFTGPGGVGKSTLVGRLIEFLRKSGQSVAVLACDPQSPLTGGALLGDRFRMNSDVDDGIFIRSLAAVRDAGAVARHLDVMIQLVEAFGFDVVLIETVGAGQGDTAVRDLADCLVLLVQPETGDDLQWEKAGILEVADVVVVHKADLPGADRAESQLRAMLALSGSDVPILSVSAKTVVGIDKLWSAVLACPSRRAAADASADLLQATQNALATWFAGVRSDPSSGVSALVTDWRQRLGDRAIDDLLDQWRRSRQSIQS
jgi:LAO/AO transport system ATPase